MTQIVERDEAVRLLRQGSVVALPTDTVYGVAASLAHGDAVATLFRLKRRPPGRTASRTGARDEPSKRSR